MHTKKNPFILIRIHASGDEGDGEQVKEQQGDRDRRNSADDTRDLYQSHEQKV